MPGIFKCLNCGLTKPSKRDRDNVVMPCLCGTVMTYIPDREEENGSEHTDSLKE